MKKNKMNNCHLRIGQKLGRRQEAGDLSPFGGVRSPASCHLRTRTVAAFARDALRLNRNEPCRHVRILRTRTVAAFARDALRLNRNEPCRHVRILRTRTVAAFAVYDQKKRESLVSKLPVTPSFSGHAWLIAYAHKKRPHTTPKFVHSPSAR